MSLPAEESGDGADVEDALADSFFRLQTANLVSVLTRAFGIGLIDTVEDMVQEAMLEAVRNWRIQGVPRNPAAWLHRVARNRVIDALRRQRGTSLLAPEELPAAPTRISFAEAAIQDSLLVMMFACCHPGLNRDSRLALTLKVLCGLGDQEIARGMLVSPAAAKRRVTRAKRYLQLNQVRLAPPGPEELQARLDTVHDVLYLMFNEGHSATRGDSPLRVDLCEEAARLCHLLCQSPLAQPGTRALMALMAFHAARFDARLEGQGAAVLLEDQDRSLWDQKLIESGEFWLAQSCGGSGVSRFHLEAGIAQLHCRAASVEATNWPAIVRLYDRLLQMQPSPFYRLNRAIALSRTGSEREALQLLSAEDLAEALRDYPFYHCALATLQQQQGMRQQACRAWEAALNLVHTAHDRCWIEQQLANCRSGENGTDLSNETPPVL